VRLTIKGGLLFLFILLKKLDDAQPFLGHALSTKLSFHILFFSASCACCVTGRIRM